MVDCRRMPKGGALHLHEYGMVSAQWILNNITYREGLFISDNSKDNNNQASGKFSLVGEVDFCHFIKKVSCHSGIQGIHRFSEIFATSLCKRL